MAHSARRLTGTGDVSTGPTTLSAITADVATGGTLTLRTGGGSGTVLATVGFVAGNAHVPIAGGMAFPAGLHATFTTLAGGVTFWLDGR